MEYCFDTLRQVFIDPLFLLSFHGLYSLTQYIKCNADSTPLYISGDFTAGNGQLHRCKDWSQLRDYATKHTACVRGGGDVPLEKAGFCDQDKDKIVNLE